MCKYRIQYDDYELDEKRWFECKEKPEKDGYCIFHHEEYWKAHQEEVTSRLYEMIKYAAEHKEKLLCIGYNVPNIALNTELPSPAYFNCCRFHGSANFRGARFKGRMVFRDSIFEKTADFYGTRFGKESDFTHVKSPASDFRSAEFKAAAHFDDTQLGIAKFSSAVFVEAVFFSSARFDQAAHFFSVLFKKYASFLNATFSEAFFEETAFEGHANFFGTVFEKDASFAASCFNYADFERATFRGKAIFMFTEFQKAKFVGVEFSKADFKGASFSESVQFISIFHVDKNLGLKIDDPLLLFQSVKLKIPEDANFDDFDVSNTSFCFTDITKATIGEKVRWKANKRLLDERLADLGEIPYENVATVYHRIRQNLESRLRHVEAGRFFVAEMDIRRKNVKIENRWLKWLRTNIFSALAWYRYFSNYGESYQRLVVWIIATPILAAFLTALTSLPLSCLAQFVANFQKDLGNYTFAFFQLKTDNLIELAIRILSLLFMGQLYIALRRQFERKYTI